MKNLTLAVVTLYLGFGNKKEAYRLLENLATDQRIKVHLRKARVTAESAWLELELHGQRDRLLEVAELLQESATIKDPWWRPASRAS